METREALHIPTQVTRYIAMKWMHDCIGNRAERYVHNGQNRLVYFRFCPSANPASFRSRRTEQLCRGWIALDAFDTRSILAVLALSPHERSMPHGASSVKFTHRRPFTQTV
eukprot:797506-Pyramimonas_sp.AAC.1